MNSSTGLGTLELHLHMYPNPLCPCVLCSRMFNRSEDHTPTAPEALLAVIDDRKDVWDAAGGDNLLLVGLFAHKAAPVSILGYRQGHTHGPVTRHRPCSAESASHVIHAFPLMLFRDRLRKEGRSLNQLQHRCMCSTSQHRSFACLSVPAVSTSP